MKKLLWIASVALLAFTSCRREEAPDNDPAGIAMIVKNGQIDYFRQIETSFRSICQEKGLEAYYYSTSSETDYQEQLAAVTELRKLGKSALKGIIFTPSYGINGENAEAEVAALAQERGIPVIILDSPVRTNGPLASAPYIGTDNIAAGKAMAQKVTAEKVAVFAAINSPGIERATAFKELKPEAEVFRVGENSSKDVLAAMDKFDDFVFFNGNSLVGSLAMLLAAGKHVYTFDVYAEFLDVLMTGSPSLKGVMAQNTFAMARKAVETVLADSGRQGEMVPTFYITTSNLDADEVQPFLEFYGRQVTPFNLAEKIIGKWEFSDKDGKEVLTNEKMVFSFVSPTKAYVSFSIDERKSTWADHVEADVKINGNKVTLTFHTGEDNTSVHELTVTAINGTMLSASQKVTVTMGGTVIITDEFACRFTKVKADYSEKILGLWECQGISGGETFNDANGRLEFLADGTYRFYRYNDNGQWEMVTTREYQDYFVDGTLVATLWKDVDGEELREWWQITTIAENDMVWIGQRQDETGAPFHQSVKWKRINLNLAENLIGKWMQAETNGAPTLTNRKNVTTFLSTTLATVSTSRETPSSVKVWRHNQEYVVQIDGSKVTLTCDKVENVTHINEYIITDINEDEMVCNFQHTTIHNGETKSQSPQQLVRLVKVEADYSGPVLGLWEGRCTSEGSEFDDGKIHRWAYMADGTYIYYVKEGDKWVPSENTLNEYFVDGNLLCTRWINDGQENREWWEITIEGNKMNWTALRQAPGGDPHTVTFEMTFVPRIAMLAKAGNMDFWRQIESSFVSTCFQEGFNPYYHTTSADDAYYEQVAAVEELSRYRKEDVKAIIFTPCYGPYGESAEEIVAALAGEWGIPVIIFDTPVKNTSPLASYPFIGTDNVGAGTELANKVTATSIAAFAKVNTPGVERGEAFKVVKPSTHLVTVGESAASEVEAVLNDYSDFVFFNGSNLKEVLPALKAAGKNVYTFDVYEEFLDELIAGSTCLKGIMAQNTFEMARKAVEAAVADSKEKEAVPAFYITSDNLTDPSVQPFLDFYKKK